MAASDVDAPILWAVLLPDADPLERIPHGIQVDVAGSYTLHWANGTSSQMQLVQGYHPYRPVRVTSGGAGTIHALYSGSGD